VRAGFIVVVRSAARRFKANTLYAKSEILLNAAPADLASLAAAFDSMAQALPGQQVFMSANDDFVFFVRLPVEPFEMWPRADRLRELLGLTAHLLMCVLVNKQGDEFQLVVPRALAHAQWTTSASPSALILAVPDPRPRSVRRVLLVRWPTCPKVTGRQRRRKAVEHLQPLSAQPEERVAAKV
jgi:hypothetical protein